MFTSKEERYMKDVFSYTKMTDDLLYLGANLILRMNVILYSNTERYGRKYYYKEIEYLDKSGIPSRKISRGYDAYLSLENVKVINNTKEFIPIRGATLEMIRIEFIPRLEDLLRNYNKRYQKRKGKLYIVDDTPVIFDYDMTIATNIKQNKARGKNVIFRPSILITKTDEELPCIEAIIDNHKTQKYKLMYSTMYGFLYILRTFQIELYASTMLASMPRPLMGTNLYDMTQGLTKEDLNNSFNINKPNGSYFNK